MEKIKFTRMDMYEAEYQGEPIIDYLYNLHNILIQQDMVAEDYCTILPRDAYVEFLKSEEGQMCAYMGIRHTFTDYPKIFESTINDTQLQFLRFMILESRLLTDSVIVIHRDMVSLWQVTTERMVHIGIKRAELQWLRDRRTI